LITSPFTPFAIPVKIHLYEEYLKSLAQSQISQFENNNEEDVEGETDEKILDDGFF
jgi:hypothetical protein